MKRSLITLSKGIIYCYTNKINGKKYIGQSINPHGRYYNHKSSAYNENAKDYDYPWHRAVRKYGWDNFTYTILDEADSIEELNQLEIDYIAYYNTQLPNGYNIEPGGRNASKPRSEETKIKLMKAHASLTEEEVIYLRNAYKNQESPSKIYREKYKDKMHYNSFLNTFFR